MISKQQMRLCVRRGLPLIVLFVALSLSSCASKAPTTTDRVIEKLEQAQASTVSQEHHELIPRHTVDENGESNVEFVLRRNEPPNTVYPIRGKRFCRLIRQKLTCVLVR